MTTQLDLEIARVKLQKGLEADNVLRMKSALLYALTHFSQDVINRCEKETHHIFESRGLKYRSTNLYDLEDAYVPLNVSGYINAIDLYLDTFLSNTNGEGLAYRALLGEGSIGKKFEMSDVLYTKDIHRLGVGNLLDVCNYAVKVGELISPNNKFYDEAGAAVCVLKGLCLVLENKVEENKWPKLLHLAGDFLTRVVKPKLERKEHKQSIVALSVFVDLTIDFFAAK